MRMRISTIGSSQQHCRTQSSRLLVHFPAAHTTQGISGHINSTVNVLIFAIYFHNLLTQIRQYNYRTRSADYKK
jgi:hypothetical protein